MNPFLYLFLLSSLLLLSLQSDLTFDRLLNQVRGLPMKTIAVSGAAKDRGIADSVLFGDEDKIIKVAKENNIDISDFKIVDSKDEIETSKMAVKYVHDGNAQMYMKGTINTKDFLKAILDKKIGLRTRRPLSTVAVFEVEGLSKMLFLTDPAVMPYPTLEEKVHIIYNTIDICNACGIKTPKVAPLATVEVVNPKMPETVEAAKLKEMNERGEITGCIIDGPLSMDLAIDSFESKLNSIILAVVYAEHIKNKVAAN